MKNRRFIFIALVVILVLTSCTDNQKPQTVDTNNEIKKTAETIIDINKETIVTNDNGVSLILPANTFGEEVSLTLESFTDFNKEGFDILGEPIDVRVKEIKAVRLNQPATVKFIIPNEQLSSIDNEEDIFASYYNGSSWEYFMPDKIDLKNGIVEFEVYHFSNYAVGKLSREEQLKYYACRMATNTWAKEEQEKNFVAKFEGYVNDMLADAYGIENKETTRKILQAMVKEIPYMGGMLVSAANGDELEFAENFASTAGKIILDQIELEGDAAGEIVTITSTYGKVAGSMSETDYEEALKDITKGLATAIISKNLVGKMLVAGAEVIDVAITDWNDKNIEDAYQAYKNGSDGEHGYNLDAKDYEQLRLQMRGINHKIYSDAISAYCKRNKINSADLTKAQEEKIRKEVDRKLKQEFDNRISKENEVDKQKAYHEKILQMFEERNLLTKGSLGYDTGMTLEERIERLYLVMGQILSHTDKKITVSTTAAEGEISIEDVCKLIGVWYSDRTNGKTKYFEELKNMGHARSQKATQGEYAWILTEVIDGSNDSEWDLMNQSELYTYSPSYSRGAYSLTWYYIGESDDYYDPPYVHGESFSVQANWSTPPEIIYKDDVVSLTVNISLTANTLSAYQAGGSTGAWIDDARMVTEDGKTSFDITPKDNYASKSGTVTAVLGEGSEGSKKNIELNFHSYNSLYTKYVYEWKKAGSN